MPQDFEIKTTADGSDTLYSSGLNEVYHSLNGAVQESMHVFIHAGLHEIKKPELRIFEVGFGTGLNALLSWQVAHSGNFRITYDAIEAFPLPGSVTAALNYKELETGLPEGAFSQLHEAVWNEAVVLEKERFSLKKVEGNFTEYTFSTCYDLVFFDAFAPDKQPEMWEEQLFRSIFQAMNDQAILVTYCAKGEVRRRMQRAGFTVERIPGPPGKREMLRAIKMKA